MHIIRTINLGILGVFIFDVLLRLFLSKSKTDHIKHNFIDFLVFVPLLQFVYNLQHTTSYVIAWQIVIIAMLVSRIRKVTKLIELLSLKPAHLMIASFAFTICVGAVLLMLPIATKTGAKIPFIDAFFTATSATCVTGLIVKDTASYFSRFGQMVILGLIQIGGLGIMTFSVSLSLILRKRIQMRQQVVMKDVLNQDTMSNIKDLVLFVIKMALIFELIGAVLLFFAWKGRFFSNIFTTAYHSLFHSISAFCNAGFSTFSDSLMQFSADISTNLIICFLIISGGLGFMVIKDLLDHLKNLFKRRGKKVLRLRIQTKVVLGMSLFLIIFGAVAIYAMEQGRSLSSLSSEGKMLIPFFQSVTTRTAGFNTCDISRLSVSTLFCMIIFMFIGGSPGSTAGGVKTTTISVLWFTIKSGLRQKENVESFKCTIPYEIIQKSVTVLAYSLFIIVMFALVLMHIEQKGFLDVLFETVSAFGTVGLSTGITPQLSAEGKLLISLLMFIGRLGPLTIAYAFIRDKKPARYKYAEESVMIG